MTGSGSSLSITPRDHVSGPPTAAVTLLEYGDFECPHCGRAYPLIEAARLELGDSLRFVFRHYPINVQHDHAMQAAEASEAAAAQGRFWEMHRLLFTHQDALDRESLLRYAAEAGLDPARVAGELDARLHRERVLEDVESGEENGVIWTPTFFVNGQRFGYAPDLDTLLGALRDAGARSR